MNIVDCTQCTHDKVCKYQQKKDEILKLYEHHSPEYPFTMKFECNLFVQSFAIPRSEGWYGLTSTGNSIPNYSIITSKE